MVGEGNGTGKGEGQASERLAALSALASRGFATLDDVVAAIFEVMERLLGMQLQMVTQVEYDRLTIRHAHDPHGLGARPGLEIPLAWNF